MLWVRLKVLFVLYKESGCEVAVVNRPLLPAMLIIGRRVDSVDTCQKYHQVEAIKLPPMTALGSCC